MFCEQCGKQLREGAAFCNRCGAQVQNQSSRAVKMTRVVTNPEVLSGASHDVKMDSKDSGFQRKQHAEPQVDNRPLINLAVLLIICVVGFLVWNSMFRFSIEGKWKRIDESAYGPIKQNEIIVFNNSRCNIYGPADVYAFYKDDGEWKLSVEETITGYSRTYNVLIRKNDMIVLSDGDGDGEDSIQLKKID